MRLLCFAIIIFSFTFLNAQSWNSTIDLGITHTGGDWIDLYVDHNGIHLIEQGTVGTGDDSLFYYRFDAKGVQQSSSFISLHDSESSLSRIVGIDGDLYICYHDGNDIFTKRSTNGGTTWTSLTTIDIPGLATDIREVDVAIEADNLHLVYNINDFNGAYYNRYNFDFSTWQVLNEDIPASDEFDYQSYPSIALDGDDVYVSYTNATWGNPIPGPLNAKVRVNQRINNSWSLLAGLDSSSTSSHIIALDGKLHAFYFYYVSSASWDLRHTYRDLSSGGWSSYTTLLNLAEPNISEVDRVITPDDSLHVTIGFEKHVAWKSEWSDTFMFSNETITYWPSISSNGNDVYVAWSGSLSLTQKDIDGGASNTQVQMRQKDYAPNAPVNLSRSIAEPTTDRHPRIDWDNNIEIDVDTFRVYKKVGSGSYSFLASTVDTFYIDESDTSVYLNHVVNEVELKYKIKARDFGGNDSDYSSEVTFFQKGDPPSKTAGNSDRQVPDEYFVSQNYPNPFNPETTIQFQIPESQTIQLVIYSVTGQAVRTLIDQSFSKGKHKIKWDGKDDSGNLVSSGIYFYQLHGEKYTQIKKMLLTK